MSEPINDGGPAFPVVASTGDPRDGVYCRDGMTLRDYFAAKETLSDFDQTQYNPSVKMAEALAGRPRPKGNDWSIEHAQWEADWRAALKFIRADAMLKAREK